MNTAHRAAVAALLTLAAAAPATKPAGRLPHIDVDAKARTVRVECEVVAADYPLEFLAVVTGTNEYEAVVRSDVKPSDLHLALLLIGLTPGSPVHYSEATKAWLPPTGPPVDVWFEYQKDGQQQRVPAYRWMRDIHTKAAAKPFTWCFTGSRTFDGVYAANQTGSLVGVINNENSVLDVPALRGRAIEGRDFERNAELLPPPGTAVTMVLSPAAADGQLPEPPSSQPTTAPHANGAAPDTLSDVHADVAQVDKLQRYWEAAVAPHRKALQDAAQAHYQVISDLRREQQRLIDEADRIQRTIDQLEKQYADMTTPQPGPSTQP